MRLGILIQFFGSDAVETASICYGWLKERSVTKEHTEVYFSELRQMAYSCNSTHFTIWNKFYN